MQRTHVHEDKIVKYRHVGLNPNTSAHICRRTHTWVRSKAKTACTSISMLPTSIQPRLHLASSLSCLWCFTYMEEGTWLGLAGVYMGGHDIQTWI
jgi:hypothetical protein